MRKHVLVWSFVVACGPSVSGDDAGPAGDTPDARTTGPSEFVDAAPPERCEKMDIVFVVDDSGSMQEEQANLAMNFPVFADVIDDFVTESGAALDYRIAVTTTGRDMTYTVPVLGEITEQGADGAFLMSSECGMNRRWIERDDLGARDSFGCIAQVGTSGPGFEMPLYTTFLAFTDRLNDGTNSGFLRGDALLALVILTDEDDCSRHDDNFSVTAQDVCDVDDPNIVDLSYYISFLDNIKGDRGRWATAVIAGETACTSAFGDAIEADRLKQFVTDVGDNAVFSSICDGDLTVALQEALATFDAACNQFPPIP